MNQFSPKTVEEHKLRFKPAIEDTYIQLDVARGIRVRPGNRPEHIFDFNDGVRLIISKEQQPDARLVIHISGSVLKDNNLVTLEDHHVHHILEHWALVSGITGGVEFLGITLGQVAHFYYRLDN